MRTDLVRKYVSSLMNICYRSVARHPFLVSLIIVLFTIYRLFPLLFSVLLSVSPVIVSTAVLLGTLLSFGELNLPEIEKELKSDFDLDEIHKLESNIEVSNRSFDDDRAVNSVGFGEGEKEMEEEKVVLGSHYSPLQQTEDEHIVLESDEKLWEGSADPLNSNSGLLWKRVEGGGDDDEEDDDEGSDSGDSGSDLAESSSPDASMADIIPMLDELHPLLSEEQETHEVPPHLSRDGVDDVSERSVESSDTSSVSRDDEDDGGGGVENREDLEVDDDDDDDEDKKSEHVDREDETRSAILWTEYDQKNLMNLGTSEMERNRRLENLILRRRARKTMRMQAEKNLIDLESADLPWNIPPISTARINPFDYDSNDNIPGSAPSVLLQRRNPFDLPYDSSEEKPDLVGDTFQQEFAIVQPKEPFFRRHESFNVGPSVFGASRNERHESRMRPYFVPERSFAEFQRQFSGLSDSRVSSVPDTESVSSVGDLENKDNIEDDHSLEAELVSEKDHEHVSDHARPYFLPETRFSTFQRQFSGLSDSKVSSVPDTESVSSDGDLENKDHIEDNDSLEVEHGSEIRERAELISESEEPLIASEHESDHQRPYFVPEHVASNETDFSSFQRQLSEVSDSKVSSVPDTDSISSVSDLENEDHIDVSREQELMSVEDYEHASESRELISEHVSQETESCEIDEAENQQEIASDFPGTENAVGMHLNLGDEDLHRSGSSSDEVSDPIYNEKDDDEVATSVSETTYFVDRSNSIERSDIDVTSLVVEESHPNEPIYDLSPRSVTRNLSSSSISNDLHKDENFQQTEDQYQSSSSVTDSSPVTRDAQNQLPNVPDKEEPLLTGDSISTSLPNIPVLETEDVLLDMDATHQVEQVQIPSLNSDAISEEGVNPEEVISQLEEEESLLGGSVDKSLMEDPEELQGRELEQGQVASLNSEVGHGETYEAEALSQPLEENPQVLQVQITSNNSDNLQIKEPENNVSLNSNSVSSVEPDVVEVADIETKAPGSPTYESDTHSIESNNVADNVDDVDEIKEIDESLLVELDAVGDFSVKDLGSTFDEIEQDPHTSDHDLETKNSGDEDSYSKDLAAILNEMKPDPHAQDHDLETERSVDEASYSKDLGSTSNEIEQDPHVPDHDLDTNRSVDEDSDAKDLEPTVNEVKQDKDTSDLDLDLVTKLSGDEDSETKDLGTTLNEMKQDQDTSDLDLVTKVSGDEDSNSMIIGSPLDDEIEQDPHVSTNDFETNRSVDEDSYSKDLKSTYNEMRQDQRAPDHRLETFYSVDENFYAKHVESTLNEMKQDQLVETNRSGDEIDAQVMKSQNETETSNSEDASAPETKASNVKLINDANEEVSPQETESVTSLANSTGPTMVNHGTENASSTSNTDKE